MDLGVRITSEETDSRPVTIDCPACGRQAVATHATDLRQTINLFFVLPIYRKSQTLVDCPCGGTLVSRLKARDLAGLDSSFAARYLSRRISPMLKTLVLGGLMAWMLPVAGTIWMGVAYGWARRYRGWVRHLALALLVLSLLPTGALIYSTTLKMGHGH